LGSHKKRGKEHRNRNRRGKGGVRRGKGRKKREHVSIRVESSGWRGNGGICAEKIDRGGEKGGMEEKRMGRGGGGKKVS